MKKIAFHWQILIALALAVVVGLPTTPETEILGVRLYDVLGFFGQMFMNALKMIVIPLVFASIVTGVASVASERGFARLGAKTFSYYIATSLFSIITGLALVNAIQPGASFTGSPEDLGLSADTAEVMDKVGGRGFGDLVGVFVRMIPVNVFQAAAEGQFLAVIFFAIVFGYFMARVREEFASPLGDFWEAVYRVMMKITLWVIRFAPIGVFALVGRVVMSSGLEVFQLLFLFFITVLAALAVHFFIVLPLILRFVARLSPLAYLRAMLPAVMMAFSTASSSSTLPMTMNCARNRVGASNRVSGFVLPLGATVNMDGTALYECVAVLFIAQAYGVELSLATQIVVVLLALLTSIGVAGVPAASLVAITLILTAVGLPAEAIALILAVDRVLDMCRTSVNVYSDACATGVVARSENEELLTPRAASATA